jgi:hypothetical protein
MIILKEFVGKEIVRLEQELADAIERAKNFDASVYKHISTAEIREANQAPVTIAAAKLNEAKLIYKQLTQRFIDNSMAIV